MRTATPWRTWSVAVSASLATLGMVLLVPSPARALVAANTITVGTTADSAADSAGCTSTGTGTFGGPGCTLRDALTKANEDAAGDTVVIPAASGKYSLNAANGSLFIDASVTIKGDSPKTVVIDGGHTSGSNGVGVLLVDPGVNADGSTNTTTTTSGQTPTPVTVSISGVTVQNGFCCLQATAAAAFQQAAFVPQFTFRAAGIDVDTTNAAFTTDLRLSDSVLTGNVGESSAFAGALHIGQNDSAALDAVTIAANSSTAGFSAGAVDAEGSLTMRNTTVQGNSGTAVGGIQLGNLSSSIEFSTLADNVYTGASNATPVGAVIEQSGTLSIGNSILTHSIDGSNAAVPNCVDHEGISSADHNVFSDAGTSCFFNGTGAHDRFNTDPKLEPLAIYFGNLPTMALQQTSPAIDGATNTETCPATDGRGLPRKTYRQCTVGAFEQIAPDPGAFPSNEAPAGGFTEIPCNDTTTHCIVQDPANGTTTMKVTDGGATITIVVPAGSIPRGCRVAVYRGNKAVLQPILPSGQTYVDAYAITWVCPDTSRPAANPAITLGVQDPLVPASGRLYQTSQSSATLVSTATVTAGAWSVGATTDPGFVLAQAAAVPAPTPTPPPVISAPIVGAAPPAREPSPQSPRVPLGVAMLVLGGLTLVAAFARRRRRV